MLICVQTQFKGPSKEKEQQVKQHEGQTLNKLSNENAWLKKLAQHIVSFPINTE